LAITRFDIAHDLVRLLVTPFIVTKRNRKIVLKKMRACATCLKRKLSEVMVPAKGNKKSENNFAGLVATTVPEKDTI